jgi:putative flavoprotein involved in K+ transport
MDPDTIVVGGSQAGLAAARHLARHGRRFLVLDAGARVGDAWRTRWDSLRLFTPVRYSGLPDLPFPAAPYHLPTKDEVADYLERYVEHFALPVRLGARVASVRRGGDGGFVVESGAGTLHASNVIVATGAFQRPRVPAFATALDPRIVQLHSSGYRNPSRLPEGDVLVVGAGNSGAQIALELAQTRRVLLAGRDTGRLPRRLLGRDIYDWIWPTIMRASSESRTGRRLRARVPGGDPLIGIDRGELRRAGIERTGRVVGARDGLPLLDDGRTPAVAAIVWCTGFGPGFEWIELPVLDAEGRPRHRRGVSETPGLYFVGLRFQTHVASPLIGGVGRDAREIVEHLVRRDPAPRGPQPPRESVHALQ